jgi:hypothetical protein
MFLIPVNDDGLTVLDPDFLSHVGGHTVPVTVLLRVQINKPLIKYKKLFRIFDKTFLKQNFGPSLTVKLSAHDS